MTMFAPTVQAVREFAYDFLDKSYAQMPLGRCSCWVLIMSARAQPEWLTQIRQEVSDDAHCSWEDTAASDTVRVWRQGWSLDIQICTDVHSFINRVLHRVRAPSHGFVDGWSKMPKRLPLLNRLHYMYGRATYVLVG